MKITHYIVPIRSVGKHESFNPIADSKNPRGVFHLNEAIPVDLSKQGIRTTATRLCTDTNDGNLHNVGMAYVIGALEDLLNNKQ